MEADAPAVDSPDFDDDDLLDRVETLSPVEADALGFGLITMDREGVVTGYNVFESRRAAISPHKVLARNFFVDVGPCTNNYLVAERYVEAARDGTTLDEVIDYVFTFRMRPTPVRLRMMARPGSPHQYLAVTAR